MPSEIMDSSSSFFSENASFLNERQIGFCESDTMPDHHDITKSIASSTPAKLVAVECQSSRSLGHPQSFLMQDQKMNDGIDRHVVRVERPSNQSLMLPRHVGQDLGTTSNNGQMSSYFVEGGKVNMMATQHENSLFSSSLSELFTRKMRLSASNGLYGHSVDTVASHFEGEEPFESLEEIEAQTIGNLLPSDDDLFSGVTDRIDNFNQPTGGEDMEELDFFSSVGGIDLGDDSSEAQKDSEFPGGLLNGQLGGNGSVGGEHPYGEHPSRTLFVRNINSNVEDSELRALFEQYGDIRTLYTACKHRGFVLISYYDIRAARNAMKALQNRPLRRRKLDIHYSIPKDNPSEKDINQGTLVVFDLDSFVSNDELLQIFGAYGEVKEIRETPHRSNHKFVEFYDVRAAEVALCALNRSDIAGKQIKLELSRPGGPRRCLLQQNPSELEQDESSAYVPQSSPPNHSVPGLSGAVPNGVFISSGMDNGTIMSVPSSVQTPFLESAFNHGISSSVPNLRSRLRVESASNQSDLAEPSHLQGHLNFDVRHMPNFHIHSLSEYQDGVTNGVQCSSPATMSANNNPKPAERINNRQLLRASTNGHSIEFNDGVFGSAGHGICSVNGHHYSWGNSYSPHPPSLMWPNTPSFVAHPAPQLHGTPRASHTMNNPVLPIVNHHVGSAPTVNPSLWNRWDTLGGESPESFHPGSLGSMRIPTNSLRPMEFVSHNIFPNAGGNYMDLQIPPQNIGFPSLPQRSTIFPGRGQMLPMIHSFDAPNERARSHRNEGSINQADKKQYELDIDRILRGEDSRTTLMIKNIPNKYTSKMLLVAIDERHKGTYDFIYLPIDFKNKCNVGYAFINMIDPNKIISFYQSFNGKKWEKFNSEKVASLAYARIQGKAALIAHFQNSSLMNEDKRCRPILFNTEGPNAGDQVPFPMGVNVRTRPGKPRTITPEESQQGNIPNLANGEDYLNGGASSGSVKDFD